MDLRALHEKPSNESMGVDVFAGKPADMWGLWVI